MNSHEGVDQQREATPSPSSQQGAPGKDGGGRDTTQGGKGGDYTVGGAMAAAREPAVADALGFNEVLDKPPTWWIVVQGIVGAPLTGIPDLETAQAVRCWKRSRGLESDGKIDRATEEQLSGEGPVPAPRKGGLGASIKKIHEHERIVAELDAKLPENPEPLDAAEIDRLRDLVAKLPEQERPQYYTRLQRAAPYADQRDNKAKENSGESAANGMCNFTSMAMDLQSLGIGKSAVIDALGDVETGEGATWLASARGYFSYGDADLSSWQYEDLIELLRRRYFPGVGRTINALYPKLCAMVGADLTDYSNQAAKGTEVFWQTLRSEELDQGKAVLLGHYGDMTKGGHILRLQEVRDDGLVVDDPFGAYGWKPGTTKEMVQRPGERWNDPARADQKEEGKDVFWSWPEVKVLASAGLWVKVMARVPEDPTTVAP